MPRVNYRHSEETKRKIGIANKNKLKGYKQSEEAKQKRMGENNWNWREGISRQEVKAGREKPDRYELCFKKSVKICFDHDHKTGKFRGWLCTKCNVALGMVNDDINQLDGLKAYLKNNGSNVAFNMAMQLSMHEEALENKELLKYDSKKKTPSV